MNLPAEILEKIAELDWPVAVEHRLTDSEKMTAAESFVESLNPYVIRKCLDFGSGDGHLAKAIGAVAYDPFTQPTVEGVDYRSTLDQAAEDGPYDTIFAIDVFDHVSDVAQAVEDLRSLCHLRTLVHVVTHPRCSRNGGHFPENLNYGWLHLALSDQELSSAGLIVESANIASPLETYKKWFSPEFRHFQIDTEEDEIPYVLLDDPVIGPRIRSRWVDFNAADLAIPYVYSFLHPHLPTVRERSKRCWI